MEKDDLEPPPYVDVVTQVLDRLSSPSDYEDDDDEEQEEQKDGKVNDTRNVGKLGAENDARTQLLERIHAHARSIRAYKKEHRDMVSFKMITAEEFIDGGVAMGLARGVGKDGVGRGGKGEGTDMGSSAGGGSGMYSNEERYGGLGSTKNTRTMVVDSSGGNAPGQYAYEEVRPDEMDETGVGLPISAASASDIRASSDTNGSGCMNGRPQSTTPQKPKGRPKGSKNKSKTDPDGAQHLPSNVVGTGDPNQQHPAPRIYKPKGRPKGSKNKPKLDEIMAVVPKAMQEVDLATGRPPRKHGESINYNVKMAFKNMRTMSPSVAENSQEKTWGSGFSQRSSMSQEPYHLQPEGLVDCTNGDESGHEKRIVYAEGDPPRSERQADNEMLDFLNGASHGEPLVGSDIVDTHPGSSHPASSSPTVYSSSVPPSMKKKRGRPAGSILVNGKLVVPEGFVRAEKIHQPSRQSSPASNPSNHSERRGRPVGSRLVNGKLILPDGFERVGKTPIASDAETTGQQVNMAHSGDDIASQRLQIPRQRRKLKRSPIVKRSFGGILPVLPPPTFKTSPTEFPRFLHLPQEVQATIWELVQKDGN